MTFSLLSFEKGNADAIYGQFMEMCMSRWRAQQRLAISIIHQSRSVCVICVQCVCVS